MYESFVSVTTSSCSWCGSESAFSVLLQFGGGGQPGAAGGDAGGVDGAGVVAFATVAHLAACCMNTVSAMLATRQATQRPLTARGLTTDLLDCS